MKFKIAPGAEFDTLTAAELRGLWNELAAPWARGPQAVRASQSVKLTAAGRGTSTPFIVPMGQTFRLHRILVDADGYTPGVPYTAAAGYIDILRADGREDFLLLAAASGGLPAVKTWGEENGVYFNNGEGVVIDIFGGPASTALTIRVTGTLSPIVTT